MSDANFMREIEEEVRRERMEKLWKNYGHYIVGAAVLVVLAVGAWRGWQWYQARENARAGERYEQALTLAEAGKQAEAEQELAALSKDAPAGYRILARLRLAAETGKTSPAEGAKAFDAIAADTSADPVLRDLARLRAALLLVDSAPASEIESRVAPLTGAKAPFRNSAKDALALSYYRSGDRAKAAALYREIIADPEVTPALANRAQIMQALTAETAAKSAAGEPAAK
jgi:hypothetical protein